MNSAIISPLPLQLKCFLTSNFLSSILFLFLTQSKAGNVPQSTVSTEAYAAVVLCLAIYAHSTINHGITSRCQSSRLVASASTLRRFHGKGGVHVHLQFYCRFGWLLVAKWMLDICNSTVIYVLIWQPNNWLSCLFLHYFCICCLYWHIVFHWHWNSLSFIWSCLDFRFLIFLIIKKIKHHSRKQLQE